MPAIKLLPHQILCVEYMKTHRGLILFHSTGSGKTFTSLYALYSLPYSIIIIGTKSSKKTYRDSIKRAEMDINRFEFYTYAKIKKILEQNILIFKGVCVIVDEAHYLRSETAYNLYLGSALKLAEKVMLLTATPIINYPNDLAVLVNIVRGEDVLPTERKLFDDIFFDPDTGSAINQQILYERIKGTISYYKIKDDANYPQSTTKWREVVMNHEQINEYVYYLRTIIYKDRDVVSDADILNVDYGLVPAKRRNFFLTITRQLSNTPIDAHPDEISPKILEIYDMIIAAPKPVIIYSNFLRNGIYRLIRLLDKNNHPYATITGDTTSDKLEIVVNGYNRGLHPILCISSAGSETLDFKNTRQIHIMEPHWNEAKIQQVIGRAVRYGSHSTLPPEERTVKIVHWVSIFPPRIRNDSADIYLMKLSQLKTKYMNQYLGTIIQASIESLNP